MFRVCNILLWNEEKETSLSLSSKICKFKEFELEDAVELCPVLYASCSSVREGVKQETNLLELTQNLYLVASIAWSNFLSPVYFRKELPEVSVL